jgi:hypothetical protein
VRAPFQRKRVAIQATRFLVMILLCAGGGAWLRGGVTPWASTLQEGFIGFAIGAFWLALTEDYYPCGTCGHLWKRHIAKAICPKCPGRQCQAPSGEWGQE